MENNVYQTPESELKNQDPEESSKKGSAVKAISIAAAVDIGGSIAVGVVLIIVYGIMLAVEATPIEEIERLMTTVDSTSTISIIGMILGSFISIFAGYLCAKIVNHNEYKTVSILGVISVVASFLMGGDYYAVIENILFGILTFGCVFFGAWLYVGRKV